MLCYNKIMKKIFQNTKGFTLIELLVVIAIIGILSSIVIASLNWARARSRDVTRLADLRQVQTALESYANDNGGSYPSTSGSWQGSCPTYGSKGVTGSNGWVPNLAPNHIATLPLDPRPVGAGGCYLYRSDGKDYMILAYQTVETYNNTNNPKPRPSEPNPGYVQFAVYTEGGRSW
jgi:prepilin-type N-terminal cleavage/methylation domain-containing protein